MDNKVIKIEESEPGQFEPGSIVWARMRGYPSWPAMIEKDPDEDSFHTTEQQSEDDVQFHVTFFGKKVSRAWVSRQNVQPFILEDQLPKLQGKHKKLRPNMREAFADANVAASLSLQERFKVYSFTNRYTKPVQITLGSDDDDDDVIVDIAEENDDDEELKDKLKGAGKTSFNGKTKDNKQASSTSKKSEGRQTKKGQGTSKDSAASTSGSKKSKEKGKVKEKVDGDSPVQAEKERHSFGKRDNSSNKGKLEQKIDSREEFVSKTKTARMSFTEKKWPESAEEEDAHQHVEYQEKTKQSKVTSSKKRRHSTSEEHIQNVDDSQDVEFQKEVKQSKAILLEEHRSTSEESIQNLNIDPDVNIHRGKKQHQGISSKRRRSASEDSIQSVNSNEDVETHKQIKKSDTALPKKRHKTMISKENVDIVDVSQDVEILIEASKFKTISKKHGSASEESAPSGQDVETSSEMKQSKGISSERRGLTTESTTVVQDIETLNKIKTSKIALSKRHSSKGIEMQSKINRSRITFSKKHGLMVASATTVQDTETPSKIKESKIAPSKRRGSKSGESLGAHEDLEIVAESKQYHTSLKPCDSPVYGSSDREEVDQDIEVQEEMKAPGNKYDLTVQEVLQGNGVSQTSTSYLKKVIPDKRNSLDNDVVLIKAKPMEGPSSASRISQANTEDRCIDESVEQLVKTVADGLEEENRSVSAEENLSDSVNKDDSDEITFLEEISIIEIE